LETDAPTPQTFQSLLFVSKILQSIANGATNAKFDTYNIDPKELKKFIENHIPILKEYASKLTVSYLYPYLLFSSVSLSFSLSLHSRAHTLFLIHT
jgi:hypothetical protein